MILPFVLLLLAMAALPAVAPRWWHHHYPKIALALAAVTLGYYLLGLHANTRVLDTAHEYFSFIALVGSLFVVSGGIHIVIRREATPRANVLFLLVGSLLANLLGTTGAAMLLIRPWIQLNRHRIRAYHIAFFIFTVANLGGCLTPIGDPPLFLGYLQGVPFWWVTQHCWPMWLAGVGLLLVIFYFIDRREFLKAAPPGAKEIPVPGRWQLDGLFNLVFLAIILGAVFITHPPFLREGLMIAAAAASYWTTQRHYQHVHVKNDFDFHPVKEVVILFAGIFSTMMPALDWLNAHARDLLGAHPSAGVFYWGTGGLSAVLDNAPTYLGFLAALSGATGASDIPQLLAQNGGQVLAISIGAVFFGAATYIGNGPNFMIKAVADQQAVRTPTFLGYLFKFTLPILLPVLVIVWAIFFR
ncbi:MAG TPA: sodium:proton antiporter [Verrucomicrobiae bacterium]|nr:sodium:proton antiporter [Verrucomicrobiae bacterium]